MSFLIWYSLRNTLWSQYFYFSVLGLTQLVQTKDLPLFKWQSKKESRSGTRYLTVNFPGKCGTDHAILSPFSIESESSKDGSKDSKNCIFSGHLVKHSDVPVTLVGACNFEDTFEVTSMISMDPFIRGPEILGWGLRNWGLLCPSAEPLVHLRAAFKIEVRGSNPNPGKIVFH